MATLDQLTVKDLAKAKSNSKEAPVLADGKYTMQFVGEHTEEHYAYFTFKYNETTYRFFYDLMLKDQPDVVNKDVFEWILALGGATVDPTKSLREVVNDAVGKWYEIDIRNYTPTKGKNAGKPQNSIKFWTKPELKVVTIEEEEMDVFGEPVVTNNTEGVKVVEVGGTGVVPQETKTVTTEEVSDDLFDFDTDEDSPF